MVWESEFARFPVGICLRLSDQLRVTACLQGPRCQPKQLGNESPCPSAERFCYIQCNKNCTRVGRGHHTQRKISCVLLMSLAKEGGCRFATGPWRLPWRPHAVWKRCGCRALSAVGFWPCSLPWAAGVMCVVTGCALHREARKPRGSKILHFRANFLIILSSSPTSG